MRHLWPGHLLARFGRPIVPDPARQAFLADLAGREGEDGGGVPLTPSQPKTYPHASHPPAPPLVLPTSTKPRLGSGTLGGNLAAALSGSAKGLRRVGAFS